MFITKPKAIALLEKAVAERGADTVVEYCTYSVPGTRGAEPNCIVGQVLAFIDPDILKRLNTRNAEHHDAYSILKDDTFLGEGVKFSQPAIDALNAAQVLQDGRDYDNEFGGSEKKMAWGETLEKVKAL